jgi:archaemetzincin
VVSRRSVLLVPWVLAGSWRNAGAETFPIVEVCPLGARPNDADVAAAVSAIEAFFSVEVTVRAPLPLPPGAYYPARGRYRADRLLEFLIATGATGARVVLGLTAVDISTTKGAYADWGVLGLATIDGRSAVLSSYRCRRAARNPAHVRERLAKTAVHELGHAFGLEHCKVRHCLMHDGEGSVLTSDEETDFCVDTRARLSAAGVLRAGARSPFA